VLEPDPIYDVAVTDAAEIQPATAAAWRKWLLRNHDSADGVWVITYRKHTGQKTPAYEELVIEALCFGWIDSKPGAVDADRTKLYFTPRRKGSGWAATNKARIERLLAEERIHPAGLAAIEHAKSDGSWTKLDGSDSLDVPTDLEAEFAAFPGSAKNFAAFPPGARRAILQWVAQAKRAETRANRIEETARLAQENVRANVWTKPE
jgi:uncharacterized protein YdeI (YjbR/CyaY-like superfamily)